MSLEGMRIGRYSIMHLIGSGGMGDVYLAEDPRIEQRVAIKVIRAEVSSYFDSEVAKDVVRLFQREARAIVKLDHPHILPLYDYGEEHIGNLPIIYLVMPYRPEGSLADWLRQREKRELLSPLDVAHIVSQAADALQHAHDHHVIHQDVKPSNFLIRFHKEAPTRPDLLLADFGIARLTGATSSISQSIRGTPSYMAPEQWEGEPLPATDQYALAVMTYELLTGRLPFQGGPGKMMYQHINVQPQLPSTYNSRLSSDIDTVLMHALAKQPEKRFASIAAFARAFQQAVQVMQSVQDVRTTSRLEVVEETQLPTAMVGVDTVAPTEFIFSTQSAGSDSETYVKPIDTPVSLIPTVALSQNEKNDLPAEIRVDSPIPVVMINTSSHKTKPRQLFIAALILLVLALVGGSIAYAIPFLFGNRPSGNRTDATVVIIPASRDLKNTYTISAVVGKLDPSKHQVGAHLVSTTTLGQSQTAKATGVGILQGTGTHARGSLEVDNFERSPLTVSAGMILQNQELYSPNIQMMLDETVTIQPNSQPGLGNSAYVQAHVVQIGTIGNIGVKSNVPDFWYNTSCNNWCAMNTSSFSGGQDPQTYIAVQKSDVDTTASTLEKANPPDPQQLIQPLVRLNERLIGTSQCKSNVTSDHKVGDAATSVTVSVNFTCTGEVYDYNGARSLAAQLLKEQAMIGPGSGYVLMENFKTNVISATLTDAQKGTVTLMVSANGIWVYQFSDAQKQVLVKLIAGKKKDEALRILPEQTGIKQVAMQLSGDTLPADASRIKIVVQVAANG